MNTRKSPKKAAYILSLGTGPEDELLLDNLQAFARTNYTTFKSMILIGLALFIEKQGTNPDLIDQIGAHLTKKHKRKR